MGKRCLKCGHQGEEVDGIIHPSSCPKCGAIYAKVERALRAKAQATQGGKPGPTAAARPERSREPAPAQGRATALHGIVGIVVLIALVLVVVLHRPTFRPPEPDVTAGAVVELPPTGPLMSWQGGAVPMTIRTKKKFDFGMNVQPLKTSKVATEKVARHYVIKFDEITGCIFFIREQESLDITLPPGRYTMKFAVGAQWQGVHALFGRETAFFKADEVLDLKAGRSYEVELVQQAGGNFPTSAIPPSSWEARGTS